MKPDGEDGWPKRTPLHIGDPHKGRGRYVVQEILACQTRSGRAWYRVQWEGIPATGNTWEPIEHLDSEEAAEKVQEFESATPWISSALRTPTLTTSSYDPSRLAKPCRHLGPHEAR